MNKTVLSLMALGVGLSNSVQCSPLLYTDYITALEAPVSHTLQQYALDGTDPDRVMNILLKQSERITAETSGIFLDNVSFLLSQKSYSPYMPTLRQLNIQTLLLNGEVAKGVLEITNLSPQEQDDYRLLWVMGLIYLDQTSKAVAVFNQLSSESYRESPAKALNLAQYMVVQHGVPSQALRLPSDGNESLALQLADFYEVHSLYAKSLSEQARRLSMLPTLVDQQAYRQSLVRFAREHDLVKDERILMEKYLKVAITKPVHVIGDEDVINEYSQLLVHYYFDTQNHNGQRQWSDGLLEAQRRFGKTNSKTQQKYLENRIYRYDEERPAFFYLDVVSLATLTQQRSLIASVFTSSLPKATQQKLLAGYFSIPADLDDVSLAFASNYAELTKGCDIALPAIVRAFKGHQLTKNKKYAQAQECFSTVVWSQTELPEQVLSLLQKEQRQVEYVVMKDKGDESAMMAIAREGPEDMRLDAAMFAVNSQPMSFARLDYLADMGGLALTPEQQNMIDAKIDERLRQSDQMELLIPRLKQNPERHSLELAYWSMFQDEPENAVGYILMRLAQPSPLAPADDIRIVRYLDSVYPLLSKEARQQVHQLSHEGIQRMVQLRAIEVTIENAFDLEVSDTVVAVQQALAIYNQLKAKLSSAPVSNATAQLWILGKLEDKFRQFLLLHAAQAPDALKPVMREQAAQRDLQYKRYVHQILDQKIEGVMDVRVFYAVLFMRGGK
ncbi:hypothetical protein [Vibrio sp. 10N.261.46.A3]|uniref:hypothetical protein n=1 Tax=Vibrio sp. 10N.261.46.A3 TaxID=3229658 RepID=UPI0035536C57